MWIIFLLLPIAAVPLTIEPLRFFMLFEEYKRMEEFFLDLVVHDEKSKNRVVKRIRVKKGESILEISIRELNAKCELVSFGKERVMYVKEIDNLPEQDDYYWEYRIDGDIPELSADKFFLTGSKKVIEWVRMRKPSNKILKE